MTEVTFFEDFHCYEYHTPGGAAPRFRYFLYAPVYQQIRFFSQCSTERQLPRLPAAFSSEFVPVSLAKIFRLE